MKKLLAFVFACFPGLAIAQQVTSFPAANLPLSGSEVLYLVQGGVSKQTPVSTLTNFGSFSNLSAGTLSVSGNSTLGVTATIGKLTTVASSASGAGFNMPDGTAPSTCQAGDMWMTSAGVFACPTAASPVGPFGSGGGVNNSAQNNLAYYATSGNTLSGLATANNSVLVTSGSGVPSLSMALPTGLTIGSAILNIKTYANSAALPTVTSSNAGQMAYVLNCQNGSEGGGLGTGCEYEVNAAGNWIARPSIPTAQLTVAGQALYLGQSTVNQGTGSKVQTSNGSFTSGHCVSFDATGATVDAGGACTTGGGGGTVTSGTVNQLAYYSATGAAVAGLATANSGVLVTSSGGVPSISTTLPANLSATTMTLISPAMSGTATYSALTGSGKLTTAASTTSNAGINIPQGATPTSPVNGDLWTTSAGAFIRINGVTQGPLGNGSGSVTNIATTSPITGGAITTTGTIACPTCATTTNGGLLTAASPTTISAAGQIACATCVTSSGGGAMTATSPIAVSSAGLITCSTCATVTGGGALSGTAPIVVTNNVLSLGSQNQSAGFIWDSSTPVIAYTYPIEGKWPWTTGSITSVSYQTGGTGSPAFNISIQINGTNVTTCNGITVSSATLTTATCGSNTIATGNTVTLVTSAITGSPSSAYVQINYTRGN